MNPYKQLKDKFNSIQAPTRLCVKDYNLDGMSLNKGLEYKIQWESGMDKFLVISPWERKLISTEVLKEVFI